jgi:hypothetical protein
MIVRKSSDIYKYGQDRIKDSLFMTDKRKKHLCKYDNLFHIKDNNLNLYFFLKDKDIRKWKDLIKLIISRVNFMRNLAKNNKPLTIWVWPLCHYKRISGKTIGVDDINSGSTITYNSDNGEIFLWRKEEILKVLIHEIIHSFKIDRNDPEPIEAYVELRALIINMYLELLERKLPLTYLDELYRKEKEFSILQSNKIKDYDHSTTNLQAYINEKGRLLNNMDHDEWKEVVIQNKASGKSLRFTITDKVLRKHPRKDLRGNILKF